MECIHPDTDMDRSKQFRFECVQNKTQTDSDLGCVPFRVDQSVTFMMSSIAHFKNAKLFAEAQSVAVR